MWRKIGIVFVLLIVFCSGAVVFRNQILLFGTKIALQKSFPQKYQQPEFSTKDGKIFIEGLQIFKNQAELTLSRLEFSVNFRELIAHPMSFIQMYRSKFSNGIQNLFSMKEYNIHCNVSRGLLQLEDQSYLFQFKDGEKKHEIGVLSLSQYDEPVLIVHFLIRGDQLISQLSMQKLSTDQFLHLSSSLFPQIIKGWKNAKGTVQLYANAIFDKEGNVDQVLTKFDSQDLRIEYPDINLVFQAENLKGELNHPESTDLSQHPFWKNFQGELKLSKGSFSLGKQLTLSHLQGDFVLEPKEDPILNLEGILDGKPNPLALKLEGKGAKNKKHSQGLEFSLHLDDCMGTECKAHLIFSKPDEKAFVFELEASHLLSQQVEMLKKTFARSFPRLNHWQIEEGIFGGRLVALFEEGQLAHFEIQNFSGKDVHLHSGEKTLVFPSMQGEGRLFDSLDFAFVLPTHQFFSFFSNEMEEIYAAYRTEDQVHLSMNVSFEKIKTKTSGHVQFLGIDESLQFGFSSDRIFPKSLKEISEGWVRSEKLSYQLYSPFVPLINEDLQVYGDVDLLATYDGKKIDYALQIDHFLTKHLSMDIKALSIGKKKQTNERLQGIFDPETKFFEAILPIRNGEAYEKKYGLYFQNLSCDLTLSSQSIKGQVRDGDVFYDGKKLLRKTKFDFSLGKEKAIHSFQAQIALSTDHIMTLTSSHFDEKNCEFTLFDKDKEWLRFKGENKELWEGSVFISPLKEKLSVQFNWDPLKEFAALKADGNDIQLVCKKQKGQFCIENLEIKGTSFNTTLERKDGRFVFPHLKMRKKDMQVDAMGNFCIDVPDKEDDFVLRSELFFETKIAAPFPYTFKTKQSLKFAFSPGIGLVASNIDLEGEGTQVQIDHFEYHPKLEKMSANQCDFSFSDKILTKLFETNTLPLLLHDLRPLQQEECVGHCNWSWDREGLFLRGVFDNEEEKLGFHLKWKESVGELSLTKEKDTLTFFTELNSEGLAFQSIQGTLYGLKTDLKKYKKRQLKGNISIDFSQFDKLFQLPINPYMTRWKVGGGYRFDGVITPKKRLIDWNWKGKIKGEGFSCKGYEIRSVDAKIDISSKRIFIENLDLTDDAGKMWISEGGVFQSDEGRWFFSFPLVEVRIFQPSFLHQMDGPEQPISSLIIKSATLQDFQGLLDDSSTITGRGSLRFLNTSKKKQQKLPRNLPHQTLAKLGLDGGLFVPALGQIGYVIQNNRCYLRDLQMMYSDKRRSEFQPPKNGVMGYLDFEGNLFIDLQVRQNVVRSITSPLSLKVRGTWKDPELIIK